MPRTLSRRVLFVFSTLSLVILPLCALAATTGTITNASPFSWSNNSGYINWNAATTSLTRVTISDSGLSGYIWAANHGWINLAPSSTAPSFVSNANGTLSGYAWGENTGWINFSGVTIDSSGKFHGHTIAQNIFGTMTFDCPTYCDVETSWTPTTLPSYSQATYYSQGSYGGGGGSPTAFGVINSNYAQGSYVATPVPTPGPSYSESSYYAEGSYRPSPPAGSNPAAQPVSPPVTTTAPTVTFALTGSTQFTPDSDVQLTLQSSSQIPATRSAEVSFSLVNSSGLTLYSGTTTVANAANPTNLAFPFKNLPAGTYILNTNIKYPGQAIQKVSQILTIQSTAPATPAQEPSVPAVPVRISTCFFDPLVQLLPTFLQICWIPPAILIVLFALILYALYVLVKPRRRVLDYPPNYPPR